jgi:hypothetical protein
MVSIAASKSARKWWQQGQKPADPRRREMNVQALRVTPRELIRRIPLSQ